jgi:SAM-dependent methyltransferase
MSHGFDKDYWEQHWREGLDGGPGSASGGPPNPYLAGEIGDLAPGTALDAGCGAGAEAIWLASTGWQVTAVDTSAEALAHAADRAASAGATDGVRWVEADLLTWDPGTRFDLVTTHYAHPAIPQLEFYHRVAEWVAPGGTLLIVGHLRTDNQQGHGEGHLPPVEASVTAATITASLDETRWKIVTEAERHRTLADHEGRAVPLHDVVVRAARRQ